MKKTAYQNTFFKRIISGFLAVVLFFNAAPLDLSVFSTGEAPEFGIVNDFKTSNPELSTTYIIKYYAAVPEYAKDSSGNIIYQEQVKKDESGNPVYNENGDPVLEKVPIILRYNDVEEYYDSYLNFSTTISDRASSATIEADGTLNLKPGEILDFTNNETFKAFLKNNNIKKVTITYVSDNDAYLYDPDKATIADDQSQASNNTYTKEYEVKFTSGDAYDLTGCTAATFTSSEYTEVDVNVRWVDDGSGRPNSIPADSFELKRKAYSSSIPAYDSTIDYDSEASYETVADLDGYTTLTPEEKGTPVVDTSNSNLHVYEYKLPKYAKNGDEYDFIAIDNKKSFAPSDYSVESSKEYRYERTGKIGFEYLSKTQFEFEMSWLDDNNTGSSRPDISDATKLSEFINNNFELKDKSGNTIDLSNSKYTISYTEVKDTNNVVIGHRVSIDGLDEIDALNGSAITYYLEKNSSATISSASGDGDVYNVSAQNSGVNSSETDKVYNGSKMNMLLSGTVNFNGTVAWADGSSSDRQTTNNIASYVLWRYVADPDMKAQVGSFSINGSDAIFSYPETLPKYDVMGRKYVYYAKQTNSISGYERNITNIGSDSLPSGSFGNGATILYKLAGKANYTVTASWIASALQGGTGVIKYELQQYDTATSNWISVERKHMSGNNEVHDNDQSLIEINGFSAEETRKHASFFEGDDILPPKYNDNGQLIQYRVVQYYADRTDTSVSGNAPSNDLIALVTNSDGSYQTGTYTQGTETITYCKLLLNNDANKQDSQGYVIINIDGMTFKVRAFADNDNNVSFQYLLYDEVDVVVNKNWTDPFVDDLVNIWASNVTVKLQRLDYDSGNYVDCTGDAYNNISGLDSTNGTVSIQRTDEGLNKRDENNSFQSESDSHYSKRLKNLPMYDEKGRLNKYQIIETSVTNNGQTIKSHKTYSTKEYKVGTVDNDELIVSNSFGDGEGSIRFKKIWLADGEEQYVTNIGIQGSIRAMRRPKTDDDTSFIRPTYNQSVATAAGRYNSYNSFTSQDHGYMNVTDWENKNNRTDLESWIFELKKFIYDEWIRNYIDPPPSTWEIISQYNTDSSAKSRHTWKINAINSIYNAKYPSSNWNGNSDILYGNYIKSNGDTVDLYLVKDGNVNIRLLAWLYLTAENGSYNSIPARPTNYNSPISNINATITKSQWQNNTHHFYYPWESGYGTENDIFPREDNSGNTSGSTIDYPWNNKWVVDSNNFPDVLIENDSPYNIGEKLDFNDDSIYPDISSTQKTEYQTYVNSVTENKKLLTTGSFLSESSSWQRDVGVSDDYNTGNGTTSNYNLRDFREYLAPGSNANGTSQLRISSQSFHPVKDSNGVETDIVQTPSDRWIEGTQTTKWYHSVQLPVSTTYNTDIINGTVSFQNASNVITYPWLAGVLEADYIIGKDDNDADILKKRYYAVQEVPTYKAASGESSSTDNHKGISEITFMNNRVGVVNYHIQFDWKVGDMITNGELQKVKIKLTADYGSGKKDVLINGSNTIEISNLSDVKDYYIYNLPKYTNTGAFISYEISEYSIVKRNNTEETFSNNSIVETDGTTYSVEREDLPTDFNSSSNSDDCYNVKFTNSLTGTTNVTVNKSLFKIS